MSATTKTLIAATAVFAAAFAFAQGTPPTPANPGAATGAGQRSTQGTPMGTTGTPGGGAATGSTSSGATMNSGTAAPAPATSGSTMSSGTSSSGSMNSGSTTRTTRTARADRN